MPVSTTFSTIAAAKPRRRTLTISCIIAAALATLTGCGDAPTGPRSLAAGSPRFEMTSTNPTPTSKVKGLTRLATLAHAVVVTKTIPDGGGKIDVPGTDFSLEIPKGAFEGKSMTFTITAYAGKVIAYDFEPHGTVFLKPLKATQHLAKTTWKNLSQLPGYSYNDWAGAYFADYSQVDDVVGNATVNELLPCLIDWKGGTLTFYIPHFSGYMISTGRDDSDDGGM